MEDFAKGVGDTVGCVLFAEAGDTIDFERVFDFAEGRGLSGLLGHEDEPASEAEDVKKLAWSDLGSPEDLDDIFGEVWGMLRGGSLHGPCQEEEEANHDSKAGEDGEE